MENVNDWPAYLLLIAGKDNKKQIAEKADVAATTVGRWLLEGIVPRAEQVIAVARAYETSPVHALIAAGYLDESDLEADAAAPRLYQLGDFTELELAEEMVRRMAAGGSDILDAPLDENHPAMQQLNGGFDDAIPAAATTPEIREARAQYIAALEREEPTYSKSAVPKK